MGSVRAWVLMTTKATKSRRKLQHKNASCLRELRGSFDIRLFSRLSELQPVEWILHQQLARPFERIVLPLRKALPVLGHQDAAAIGMSGEVHTEHVVHLALQPV